MTPYKLTRETTLDDYERGIIYTRAALAADPNASDLLHHTDNWEARVDAARNKRRASWVAEVGADAQRRVSNDGLDASASSFGAELGLESKPGTEGYRLFFRNMTASRFVKQALATQVGAMEAWLPITEHPVLERHRARLTSWIRAARAALTATDAAAVPMGQWQIERATLADDMTRERDALWAALDERRRERNLPRDWPSLFFTVQARGKTRAAEEDEGGEEGE
jgi:hypothetical protein